MPAFSVRRLLTLSAALGLGACGPTITSDRDVNIPFPAGSTVAFFGTFSEGTATIDPAVGNDIVHRRIEASIAAQLTSRGFKLVTDPEQADFLVRYFVAVRRSTNMVTTTTSTGVMMGPSSAWGPGWGHGWGRGWQTGVSTTRPVTSTNASFDVDLVQRSTGNTAWRGTSSGEPARNRAPTQGEVDGMMARLFRTMGQVG